MAIVLAIHALVLLALIAGDRVLRPVPPQTLMLMTVLPQTVAKPPPPPEIKKPRSPLHEAAAPRMRDVEVPLRTEVAPPVIVAEAPPVAPAGGKPDGVGTAGAGNAGAGAGGPAAGPVTVKALLDPDNCPPFPLFPGRPHLVGTVILAVQVGVDGRVTDARIARSSGKAILDQTALESVVQCRFVAATIDKVPVESWEAFRYSWANR